jgi:hypothetical protein
MIDKKRIANLIVEMGEGDFFDSLVRVVKDREITEWVDGGENFDDKAYKEFTDATTCAGLLAYRMREGSKESAKRKDATE